MLAMADWVVDARFAPGEAIGLTLDVPFPAPIGPKLLQRPADEPLGKCLGRMKATVEKGLRKKGKGKKGEDAASAGEPTVRLEEPDGTAVAEHVPNSDAWIHGRILVAGRPGLHRRTEVQGTSGCALRRIRIRRRSPHGRVPIRGAGIRASVLYRRRPGVDLVGGR